MERTGRCTTSTSSSALVAEHTQVPDGGLNIAEKNCYRSVLELWQSSYNKHASLLHLPWKFTSEWQFNSSFVFETNKKQICVHIDSSEQALRFHYMLLKYCFIKSFEKDDKFVKPIKGCRWQNINLWLTLIAALHLGDLFNVDLNTYAWRPCL